MVHQKEIDPLKRAELVKRWAGGIWKENMRDFSLLAVFSKRGNTGITGVSVPLLKHVEG